MSSTQHHFKDLEIGMPSEARDSIPEAKVDKSRLLAVTFGVCACLLVGAILWIGSADIERSSGTVMSSMTRMEENLRAMGRFVREQVCASSRNNALLRSFYAKVVVETTSTSTSTTSSTFTRICLDPQAGSSGSLEFRCHSPSSEINPDRELEDYLRRRLRLSCPDPPSWTECASARFTGNPVTSSRCVLKLVDDEQAEQERSLGTLPPCWKLPFEQEFATAQLEEETLQVIGGNTVWIKNIRVQLRLFD